MISAIIAPPSTWRPPATIALPPEPPALRMERVDLELVETLRHHGRYGTLIWPLLNEVAENSKPQTRSEARQMRLDLWHRLRRLLKAGVIFRFGRKRVSTVKLPKQTVNRRPRAWAGSAVRQQAAPKASQFEQGSSKPRNMNYSRQFGALDTTPTTLPTLARTESAKAVAGAFDSLNPTPAVEGLGPPLGTNEQEVDIGQAARELARLPRRVKRRWSGHVNGIRIWHNQRIILPGGELAYAYGALRGKVVWTSRATNPNADLSDDNWALGVVDASQVRIFKNPHAVALGKMKAGSREKESEAKKQAARANGLKARQVRERPNGHHRPLQF